jgi:RHS repeat-associated protein
LIAQIEADGTVYYIHTDHLATPRAASDGNQVVVWSWLSDAFGQAPPIEDVDGDGVSVTINHRFPGQYYDAETGLHYNWHRFYDPETGRYISADPIGLDGGMNLYAYVQGNPVNGVDVAGLCWSNARAIAHYENPFSGDVTLSQTGCVAQVSAASSGVRTTWKNEVKKLAEAASKSFHCPGGGSGTVQFNSTSGFQSGIFWMRGVGLSNSATCKIKKDCCAQTWSYSCKLSNRMNDHFTRPFDWDNSDSDIWDRVETGRTFFVTHTWTDSCSDSGTF